MSELTKKIEASITGKRYMKEPVFEPLLYSESRTHKPIENPFLTEYWVGVKLGHTIKVEDGHDQAEHAKQKEEALRRIQKAIRELVYGEFRGLLARAQYQLYDRDFENAAKSLSEIETRMFYE